MKLSVIARTLLIGIALTMAAAAYAGWDPRKAQKMNKEVAETIAAFKKKDPSLKVFIDKAYGYAVFPTVGKGGIGIGGAHGKGAVYRRDAMIGFSSLTQVTIGFQLGGQAYSELIFFKDKTALDRFTGEGFEFSAQVSAVAVKAGAAANVDYSGGVAIFTMTKGGLMYEASVGGQKFSFTPKK